MCDVDYDKKTEIYTITKNIETTGEKISSEIKTEETKSTYAVYHKKGSTTFKPFILIGSRKIKNDIANQVGDIPSCPEDDKYKCNKNNFYVLLRFL